MLVRFYVTGESRLRTITSQAQSWDSTNLRSTVDFDKVQEGTVILELMHRKNGARAWIGETSFTLSEKRRAEDESRAVVTRLSARYPPRPGAR